MHWKVVFEEMNNPILLAFFWVGCGETSHIHWPLKDGLQAEVGHLRFLLADDAGSREASPVLSITSELPA